MPTHAIFASMEAATPDAVIPADHAFAAADQYMSSTGREECFIPRQLDPPDFFTHYIWGRRGRVRRLADMLRPHGNAA